MPLPTPNKNEEKDVFIARCIETQIMKKDFPNLTQRIAVCVSQWDNKDKSIYGNEIEYDHSLHFSKEQMEELHKNGILYVTQIDEDGSQMIIKFTY